MSIRLDSPSYPPNFPPTGPLSHSPLSKQKKARGACCATPSAVKKSSLSPPTPLEIVFCPTEAPGFTQKGRKSGSGTSIRARTRVPSTDRKSVVQGKSVDLG